jgi:hypothetical protein
MRIMSQVFFASFISALIVATCKVQHFCADLGIIATPDAVIRLPIQKSALTVPKHLIYLSRGHMIRVTLTVFVIVSVAAATAGSASLDSDHWLIGEFTQNVPCKGDGSDPAELKARIFTNQIASKAGVCMFLDARPESNRVKAHALCQFPAGPLMGDFTFTRKSNGTIDFVDRDGTYTAILYRCPK